METIQTIQQMSRQNNDGREDVITEFILCYLSSFSPLRTDGLFLIISLLWHFKPLWLSLFTGNIFTPVCHSVHRGGGVLPQCMLGYPPGSDTTTPPWTRQTPPIRHHPPRTRQTTPPGPGRHPPDQTPPRSDTPPGPGRHPPRSDTTPWIRHPPRPGRPPPREADSSIRSTSGRYASYWNAFLL